MEETIAVKNNPVFNHALSITIPVSFSVVSGVDLAFTLISLERQATLQPHPDFV
jgi:hypothetical protein